MQGEGEFKGQIVEHGEMSEVFLEVSVGRRSRSLDEW